MIALHASNGIAQTLASGVDTPVAQRPAAMASNIPEVVRSPEQAQPVAHSKAVSSPAAVLTPPTIDLQFLRAIRLDWDQVGDSTR
jgi:hypothetical protein